MNRSTAGYAACAAVAAWVMLSGRAVAAEPAPESAPAPALTDISQVKGLESTLYVSESASVTRPMESAPSAEDLARAAMQKQTQGMAPGVVAGGPKDQVIIHIPDRGVEDHVSIQRCQVVGGGGRMFAQHLGEIRVAVHIDAGTLFAQRAQTHHVIPTALSTDVEALDQQNAPSADGL